MFLYHGTSSAVAPEWRLLPPCDTGICQEQGRKKNLDKVFATPDIGLAKIYAGRACRRFGGSPVILRVSVPDTETEVISDNAGATVVAAPGGFVVEVIPA